MNFVLHYIIKCLIIEYLRVRAFGMIRKRITDPRSLGSRCIKGTDRSTLGKDFSVPLMQHHVVQVILDQRSFFGSSQRNTPLEFSVQLNKYQYSLYLSVLFSQKLLVQASGFKSVRYISSAHNTRHHIATRRNFFSISFLKKSAFPFFP